MFAYNTTTPLTGAPVGNARKNRRLTRTANETRHVPVHESHQGGVVVVVVGGGRRPTGWRPAVHVGHPRGGRRRARPAGRAHETSPVHRGDRLQSRVAQGGQAAGSRPALGHHARPAQDHRADARRRGVGQREHDEDRPHADGRRPAVRGVETVAAPSDPQDQEGQGSFGTCEERIKAKQAYKTAPFHPVCTRSDRRRRVDV